MNKRLEKEIIMKKEPIKVVDCYFSIEDLEDYSTVVEKLRCAVASGGD